MGIGGSDPGSNVGIARPPDLSVCDRNIFAAVWYEHAGREDLVHPSRIREHIPQIWLWVFLRQFPVFRDQLVYDLNGAGDCRGHRLGLAGIGPFLFERGHRLIHRFFVLAHGFTSNRAVMRFQFGL